MAIQIDNADTLPALVYDRVLMQNLQITQKLSPKDAVQAHYTLTVELRMYAVDGDGNRHYGPKTDMIIINDYLAEAMKKAMQGDMDLAMAAEAIENALVQIIKDQRPDLGTARRV